MAVLVEGEQYGLSSKGHSQHNNKSRVFVKLTDSALRAIEAFINARPGGYARQPTIQFLQNHGVIKIPSAQNSGTEHSFTFSLSSAAEESLQGSFEFIQQNGRSLESLGSMQYKMHIQAKDDVYEVTKQRMATAEEESKKNCTKVIKASSPYVCRKVKVKKPNALIPPKPSSSPPYSKHSSSVPSKLVINGHSTTAPLNGFQNAAVATGTAATATVANTNKPSSSKQGNPDIMRKTYRERIIQLLAIRSYKKPELLARLMKDGVREKDKKSLSSVLSQVATMKENTYTLAKHAFAEIQEDWPFYSEPDRQLLKRRLLQNSAVNGSESPPIPQPSTSPSTSQVPVVQKRNSGEPDMVPAKRPRISHFVSKPDPPFNGQSSSQNLKPDIVPPISSSGNGSSSISGSKPNSSPPAPATINNGFGRFGNNGNITSNGDVRVKTSSNVPVPVPTSTTSVTGETNGYHLKKFDLNGHVANETSRSDTLWSDQAVSSGKGESNNRVSSLNNNNTTNSNNGHHNSYHQMQDNFSRQLIVSSDKVNGHSTSSTATPVGSPTSVLENESFKDFQGTLNRLAIGGYSSLDGPMPFKLEDNEYLKKYTEITNNEQRARYKADFNAEYEEYRCLHCVVDQVSKQFSILKDNLRNAKEFSEDWLRIRDQIVREYSASKRNEEYQAARRRFQYLHEKLSHIKRLVADYDRDCGIDT